MGSETKSIGYIVEMAMEVSPEYETYSKCFVSGSLTIALSSRALGSQREIVLVLVVFDLFSSVKHQMRIPLYASETTKLATKNKIIDLVGKYTQDFNNCAHGWHEQKVT